MNNCLYFTYIELELDDISQKNIIIHNQNFRIINCVSVAICNFQKIFKQSFTDIYAVVKTQEFKQTFNNIFAHFQVLFFFLLDEDSRQHAYSRC